MVKSVIDQSLVWSSPSTMSDLSTDFGSLGSVRSLLYWAGPFSAMAGYFTLTSTPGTVRLRAATVALVAATSATLVLSLSQGLWRATSTQSFVRCRSVSSESAPASAAAS